MTLSRYDALLYTLQRMSQRLRGLVVSVETRNDKTGFLLIVRVEMGGRTHNRSMGIPTGEARELSELRIRATLNMLDKMCSS